MKEMRCRVAWLVVVAAIGASAAWPQCRFAPAFAIPTLKVGDPAPPFSLPGSDGEVHTLSKLAGRYVVLAWFAKAFTGG